MASGAMLHGPNDVVFAFFEFYGGAQCVMACSRHFVWRLLILNYIHLKTVQGITALESFREVFGLSSCIS